MALLQITLEVDPDVYPELHAALTKIASDASRAERVRQLAMSGLVWEKLRLGAPVKAPAAALRPAVAAPQPSVQPAIQPAPQAAPHPVPQPVPQPMPQPTSAGFVDLALDAAPERPQPSWPPPVLHDVIEPAPPPPEPPLPHHSSTRARLLRMKDKGLFRNG